MKHVNERWKLRNGSVAHISERGGGYAVGIIDDSFAVHVWHKGTTAAGPGYDLIFLIPDHATAALPPAGPTPSAARQTSNEEVQPEQRANEASRSPRRKQL